MPAFLEKLTRRFNRKTGVEMTPTEKATWSERLDRVVFILLGVVVLAFPVVFLPLLANWFDLPKITLLIIGTTLAASLWLLPQATNQKLNLVRSPFDLPAILLMIIVAVSAFFTANRSASLAGDPLVFAGAILLFFLITQTITKLKPWERLVKILLAGGAILSLWTILQTGLFFAKPILASPLLSQPVFLLNFSPAGSHFSALVFLVSLLPLALGLCLGGKKRANSLLLLILVIGAATTGFALYKNPPVLLPVEMGWKIATGTMGKAVSTALLGVGPGNFVDAFTLYRPIDFNATSFWNLRFTGGANFYFYLLTTVGLAGLATLGWLVVRFLTLAKKRLETPSPNPQEKGLIGSLVVILLVWVFLPGPAILTMSFFILLGLFVTQGALGENLNLARPQAVNLPANPWLRFVPGLVMLAVTAFFIFNLGKLLLADYFFAQSLTAAAANLGTQTYNFQIKALSLAPANDSYHLSYSQTNLALADSLAGQPNLSDQQKQTVVQLVQQAIREGRTAVALAPNRAANYENLSLIYRSLINFAQGADQWAVAALQQAVSLDPTNPNLRLSLGGIYFAGKDYLTAAQIFSQAANLKPDLPNAHYNLAQALKNLNMKSQALSELQMVASLVCTATANADCDQVNNEIASLNASENPVSAATASANLKTASESAQTNLKNAKTVPPAKIGSPSGEIQP